MLLFFYILIYIIIFQKSEDDVSQFDTKFTKQAPIDSPVDSVLSESDNQIFMVNIHKMFIKSY